MSESVLRRAATWKKSGTRREGGVPVRAESPSFPKCFRVSGASQASPLPVLYLRAADWPPVDEPARMWWFQREETTSQHRVLRLPGVLPKCMRHGMVLGISRDDWRSDEILRSGRVRRTSLVSLPFDRSGLVKCRGANLSRLGGFTYLPWEVPVPQSGATWSFRDDQDASFIRHSHLQ
jgi:hypothetical protein